MQIVHMQPLVSSLSASDRLVQPLRKDSCRFCCTRWPHCFEQFYFDLLVLEYLFCLFSTANLDIPVQEDQNNIVQKQCSHLVQQNLLESFLSGCTRRSLAESDDTRGCICTICIVDS